MINNHSSNLVDVTHQNQEMVSCREFWLNIGFPVNSDFVCPCFSLSAKNANQVFQYRPKLCTVQLYMQYQCPVYHHS